MRAFKEIVHRQRAWAASAGVPTADDYTLSLEDNLICPPCEATRADFADGDGGEMNGESGKPKIQALYSSSALVVNTFEFWRNRDLAPLASALRLPSVPDGLRFEAKFPTGLRGKAANLDVVFTLSDEPHTAVESKFREPYVASVQRGAFSKQYFPPSRTGRWERLGLSHCQAIAQQLKNGERSPTHLDEAQLLKHILGLATARMRPVRLVYLWYDAGGQEAAEHQAETAAFAAAVRADLDFIHVTYQELLGRLLPNLGPDAAGYARYLTSRYLNGGGA